MSTGAPHLRVPRTRNSVEVSSSTVHGDTRESTPLLRFRSITAYDLLKVPIPAAIALVKGILAFKGYQTMPTALEVFTGAFLILMSVNMNLIRILIKNTSCPQLMDPEQVLQRRRPARSRMAI